MKIEFSPAVLGQNGQEGRIKGIEEAREKGDDDRK